MSAVRVTAAALTSPGALAVVTAPPATAKPRITTSTTTVPRRVWARATRDFFMRLSPFRRSGAACRVARTRHHTLEYLECLDGDFGHRDRRVSRLLLRARAHLVMRLDSTPGGPGDVSRRGDRGVRDGRGGSNGTWCRPRRRS